MRPRTAHCWRLARSHAHLALVRALLDHHPQFHITRLPSVNIDLAKGVFSPRDWAECSRGLWRSRRGIIIN